MFIDIKSNSDMAKCLVLARLRLTPWHEKDFMTLLAGLLFSSGRVEGRSSMGELRESNSILMSGSTMELLL